MSLATNGKKGHRTAIVTGGAVRVGRAITLGLAEDGFDVVVCYHSSGDAARDTAKEVAQRGRRCVLVQVDLSDPSASDTIMSETTDAFGAIDLLVNSASSFAAASLLDVGASEWDEVMAVNVRAPHLLVRAAASALKARRGSVVNIVDLSAFQPWTTYPHHSVSKAALAHLTKVQAVELAPDVRVNAIAPGAVLAPEAWSDAEWRAIASKSALGRPGSPHDVVGALRYLVDADFVTGQTLFVDGGRLL